MPLGLAGADGTIWVASGGNITFPAPASDSGAEAGVAILARIEVATGDITNVEVGPAGDIGVVAAFGDAWVLRRAGEVIRIHGASLKKVVSIRVPRPAEAAADDSSLWVIGLDGTLTRIDPRTNRVVAEVDTGVPATRGIENNAQLVPPNNGVPATGSRWGTAPCGSEGEVALCESTRRRTPCSRRSTWGVDRWFGGRDLGCLGVRLRPRRPPLPGSS